MITSISIWLAGPGCCRTLGQRLLLTLTSHYRSPLGMGLLENSRCSCFILGCSLVEAGLISAQNPSKYLSILRSFDAEENLIKSNKIICAPIFLCVLTAKKYRFIRGREAFISLAQNLNEVLESYKSCSFQSNQLFKVAKYLLRVWLCAF